MARGIVGVRDAVRDGGGGYLARTTEDWIARLAALARGPGLRREAGASGRAFAESLDVRRVTRDLEALYLDWL